jgi:hypothetical protein
MLMADFCLVNQNSAYVKDQISINYFCCRDEIAHDEQVSFASRMQNLLLAFSHSKEAKFIDDFLTGLK